MVTIKKIEALEPNGSWLYPIFCSMKRLGVFVLPPGWDASPFQVNLLQFVRFPQQFAGTWVAGERQCDSEVSNQEHNSVWLEPGLLDLRTSALTIKATVPP